MRLEEEGGVSVTLNALTDLTLTGRHDIEVSVTLNALTDLTLTGISPGSPAMSPSSPGMSPSSRVPSSPEKCVLGTWKSHSPKKIDFALSPEDQ